MKTTIMGNKKEDFIKSLVLIIAVMFLTACSNITAQTSLSEQQKNRFSSEELIGHRLSLVSKTSIGEFSFVDKGHIVATIGTVGGPVAGPVLEWQLDRQGHLIIDFDDFKQSWTKLSMHGDLIEVEQSTIYTKPYRHEYIIQTGESGPAAPNYPKFSFTTSELAGSTLLFDINLPGRKYVFNANGTGTFSVDPSEGIELSEDWRNFRWSVDQEGKLHMTHASGMATVVRKLSRVNNNIVAEFTEQPSPPTKAIYRRSKK